MKANNRKFRTTYWLLLCFTLLTQATSGSLLPKDFVFEFCHDAHSVTLIIPIENQSDTKKRFRRVFIGCDYENIEVIPKESPMDWFVPEECGALQLTVNAPKRSRTLKIVYLEEHGKRVEAQECQVKISRVPQFRFQVEKLQWHSKDEIKKIFVPYENDLSSQQVRFSYDESRFSIVHEEGKGISISPKSTEKPFSGTLEAHKAGEKASLLASMRLIIAQ